VARMIDYPFFAASASCSQARSHRLSETVNHEPVYHKDKVGAADEPSRLSEGENGVRTSLFAAGVP
jgi:hypothetical protein